jgi:hypothetical protein
MFDIDNMCKDDKLDAGFSLFLNIFSGVANPDPCLHGGNHPHLTLLSPTGPTCRLQIMSVSLVLTYYIL